MRLHSKNLVMVEVIDNFLPSYQFKQLQSFLLNKPSNCDWYYNNGINGEDDPPGTYQFVHGFFDNSEVLDSPNFSLIQICANKLDCNNLIRVKANLNPRTFFHRNGGYHLDSSFPMKVTILYINTNNGCTMIKGYGKVKCVANRLVKFHSTMLHAGVSCTDEKVKVVVNFNYE